MLKFHSVDNRVAWVRQRGLLMSWSNADMRAENKPFVYSHSWRMLISPPGYTST